MQDDVYLVEGQKWLRYAQGDLQAAEAAIGQSDFEPRHVCFFAQQAAEKALKAILVFLQHDVPRTHDLDVLISKLPQKWPLVQEFDDLNNLTDWAVDSRYPDPENDATDEDASESIRQARAVFIAVWRDLRAHGFDIAFEEVALEEKVAKQMSKE